MKSPRPGSRLVPPERRITATETSTAAPATTICTVIASPRISQPSATATIGLTYAYVETSEIGATRSSHT